MGIFKSKDDTSSGEKEEKKKKGFWGKIPLRYKLIGIGIIVAILAFAIYILIIVAIIQHAIESLTAFLDFFGFENTNIVSSYVQTISENDISDMNSNGFSTVKVGNEAGTVKAWFSGEVLGYTCDDTCCVTVQSRDLDFGSGTDADDFKDLIADDDGGGSFTFDLTAKYCGLYGDGLPSEGDVISFENGLDFIGYSRENFYTISILDQSNEFINPKTFIKK